jgi:hypothetical protein
MTVLINIGRAAMALWVVYSLVLIFAPAWVHQMPNLKAGIIQFLVAYSLGYLLDRALSVLRRRKAAHLEAAEIPGRIQADESIP